MERIWRQPLCKNIFTKKTVGCSVRIGYEACFVPRRGMSPPPLSVIRERLRAATGELQLVCNDSGVCPCDGFYGASSPCALSFSASRCFSGSMMMPTPFPLRSKTWFPTWKGCCPCLPNMPWTNSNRMKRKRHKRGGEEEDAKEADVYEANPRYTIEQDPEQGEVLRSEIQKGDTAGKSLGTRWMQTTLPSCSRRPSRYMP